MNNHTAPYVKTYTLSMIACILIYSLLVIGINILDNRFDLQLWQRIVMSLLPVLPAIAMLYVVIRFVRTMDEVWQKIVTESTIISAGIVGAGTFTLGFLEGVINLPNGLLIWVWPSMFMVYGIVTPFVHLRYS